MSLLQAFLIDFREKMDSKFSKKNYESQQTSTQEQKVTVELNDLDWADRETVLRLLFSKMNTGDQATNWRDQALSAS